MDDLNEHINTTLRSLEPSFSDLVDHDCATHPKITHERWLQCQHEIRAMLAGTRDPEYDAVLRAYREREQEMLRRYWP